VIYESKYILKEKQPIESLVTHVLSSMEGPARCRKSFVEEYFYPWALRISSVTLAIREPKSRKAVWVKTLVLTLQNGSTVLFN